MNSNYYLHGPVGVDVTIFPTLLPNDNDNIPWYLAAEAQPIPSDRMPKADNRLFVIEDEDKIEEKSIFLGDVAGNTDNLTIFSEKALRLFKQETNLGSFDEYEITIKSSKDIKDKYFLINFQNLIPLDNKKSKLRNYSDGELAAVTELVFDKKELSDAPDFVKSKTLPWDLYVSEKVIKVVKDNKLMNFEFVGPFNGEAYAPNDVIQFPERKPDGTLDDFTPLINLIQ